MAVAAMAAELSGPSASTRMPMPSSTAGATIIRAS